MQTTLHAPSGGERPSFAVTGDLSRRLELALNIALGQSVFNPDVERRREAIRGVLRAFCNDDWRGMELDSNPEIEDFDALLGPVIPTPSGPRANTIWTHPAFLLPAIAALAQLFDRMLDPHCDSAITLTVESQPDSLTGYALRDISRMTMRRDGQLGHTIERPLDEAESLRLNTLLAASALLVVEGQEHRFPIIATNYLRYEAARSGSGQEPNRNAMTGSYRIDGSSGFILVVPRRDAFMQDHMQDHMQDPVAPAFSRE